LISKVAEEDKTRQKGMARTKAERVPFFRVPLADKGIFRPEFEV
jgi:hypothetical protein